MGPVGRLLGLRKRDCIERKDWGTGEFVREGSQLHIKLFELS